MPRCKSCGAEIRWVKTMAGKNMPIDARPEKRFVDGDDIGIPGGGWSLEDTYVSHFATCPNAAKHRKDKS